MSVRSIVYRRSRDNMAKLINKFQITLKRVPEWNTTERDRLVKKIEMLKIIRVELKQLIRELE